MKKLRFQILFSFMAVVLGVLLSLGVLLTFYAKSFYENREHMRIKQDAKFIEYVILHEKVSPVLDKSELENLATTVKLPFGIVNGSGDFVFTTKHFTKDVGSFTSVIDRSLESKKWEREVTGSRSGVTNYIFPFKSDSSQYHIAIQVSNKVFFTMQHNIWIMLGVCMVVASMLSLFIGQQIISRYMKPLDAATKVATELAKGNYKARTYEYRHNETNTLSTAINTLASNLEVISSEREVQNERMQTLIHNMGSGLLLIDERGFVRIINRYLKQLLLIDAEKYEGELYYEVIRYAPIIQMIEEIFMKEIRIKKQVSLHLNLNRKDFYIYGAPITNANHQWRGIVLVFHDITDLKNLEKIRKDFVANVSHELRTPITSIKGYTETLLDGAYENPNLSKQFLQIISKESLRMESIVNDLLDLSQIEKDEFKVNISEVHLHDVIQEVVTSLSQRADKKAITVKYEAVEAAKIHADEGRIRQIILNLLANAITYTPEEGEIEIKLHDASEEVFVSIRDTGIGIEMKEIPRIFERFYRVDRARSRNSGGTGLGLAIVKHLMEVHKGEIVVESKVGKGTTFTLKFKKNPKIDPSHL